MASLWVAMTEPVFEPQLKPLSNAFYVNHPAFYLNHSAFYLNHSAFYGKRSSIFGKRFSIYRKFSTANDRSFAHDGRRIDVADRPSPLVYVTEASR